MENLRWILIFAGVAILVLLYVSGRSTGAAGRRRDARADPDPLLGDERAPRGRRAGAADHELDLAGFEVDPDDLERPGAPARRGTRAAARPRAPVHDFETVSEVDFEPVGYADAPHAPAPRRVGRARAPSADVDRADGGYHGPEGGRGYGHDDGYGADDPGRDRDWVADDGYGGAYEDAYDGDRGRRADARDDGARAGDEARGRGDGDAGAGGAASALGGLGRRIESLGARLGAGRREGGAERDAPEEPAGPPPTKVVTLHVVSPDGAWFDGASIAEAFEARGYAFGEMDIFHSMHRGRIVFSIAKMVEPGRFDPEDIESFATPGLVMILQLPGPVPADAAFDVLLAEAHELGARLDARILDGERSTLSKQSAQHMRDGIREFMHRQKYYGAGAG